MKIIYNKENETLEKKLNGPVFLKLCALFSRKETYILRELKEHFTKEEKIETQLEYLIKQQIIQRQDRRYTLKLANPSLTEDHEMLAQWVDRLIVELREQPIQVQLTHLILLLQTPQEFSPFLLPEEVTFAFSHQVGNDLGVFYSIGLDENSCNLPNYFLLQRQAHTQTQFPQLQRLIGDVDPDYYIDQAFVVLDKILAKRRRIRSSIFVESLKIAGVIEEKEEWQIKVPIVNDLTSSWLNPDIPNLFSKLDYYMQRRIIAEILDRLNLTNATLLQLYHEKI